MTRTRNDCSSRAIRREIEREDNYRQRVEPVLRHLDASGVLARPLPHNGSHYGTPRVRRS